MVLKHGPYLVMVITVRPILQARQKKMNFPLVSKIEIKALIIPSVFLPADSPGLPRVLIGGILILIFGDISGYKQTLKRKTWKVCLEDY